MTTILNMLAPNLMAPQLGASMAASAAAPELAREQEFAATLKEAARSAPRPPEPESREPRETAAPQKRMDRLTEPSSRATNADAPQPRDDGKSPRTEERGAKPGDSDPNAQSGQKPSEPQDAKPENAAKDSTAPSESPTPTAPEQSAAVGQPDLNPALLALMLGVATPGPGGAQLQAQPQATSASGQRQTGRATGVPLSFAVLQRKVTTDESVPEGSLTRGGAVPQAVLKEIGAAPPGQGDSANPAPGATGSAHSAHTGNFSDLIRLVQAHEQVANPVAAPDSQSTDSSATPLMVLANGAASSTVLDSKVDSPATALPSLHGVDPAEVVSQVSRSIQVNLSTGISEVRLKLHPEQLGDVTLKLIVSGHDVQAHAVVSNAGVQQALEGQVAVLRRQLADNGLNLTGLSVSVGGQGSFGQAFHEQSQGDRQADEWRSEGRDERVSVGATAMPPGRTQTAWSRLDTRA